MKNPSRKFVELIHATSTKWVNWDPLNEIKVGDYGVINRETGILDKEGNIYEDSDPIIANLAVQHKPLTEDPEDKLILSSVGVMHHELDDAAECGIDGLANASIKGQWKFGPPARRGGLLVMSRPRRSYVPPKVLLKHLVDLPIFKNKVLVTEIVSCPAYSFYLSTPDNDVLELALIGTTPTPPGTAVEGDAEATWKSRNKGGTVRQACDPNGLYNYTPLYILKKIRQKHLLRRESYRPPPENDDLWIDVQEPWEPLDDEGEEEAFDGSISD
jgi:hypothetical protein